MSKGILRQAALDAQRAATNLLALSGSSGEYHEPWIVGPSTQRAVYVDIQLDCGKNKQPFTAYQECVTRAVDCVNALQGIPTDQLGEVKKAWLAWGLSRSTSEHTFNYAVQRRKEGRDYGELNALIDSVKE